MTKNQKILSFVLLFALLETLLILYIDRPLSLFMRQMDVDHRGFVDFFRDITDFGKGKWYMVPTALLVAACAFAIRLKSVKKKTRELIYQIGEGSLFIFACVAISGIVTDLLKIIIGRSRPVLLDRENVYAAQFFVFDSTWKSMPSGHTTTVIAAMCALFILLPRWRWVWLAVALILVASRVVVNAHYLSDVLAGSLVGCVSAILINQYFNHNGINHVKNSIFPIDRKSSRA
ncbi:MAG: phosphatase PAP2 family protein [Alphaproteobacteria bacterium]